MGCAVWPRGSRRRRRRCASVVIETDAGAENARAAQSRGCPLHLPGSDGAAGRYRAGADRRRAERVEAVTLRVGNPQCVVLGEVTQARLHSLASALAVHPRFPAGTNVELATVERPDHVRILIWERGVGPTEASGTGACAAAVAAMQYGGASRDVRVESPGGTPARRVAADGLFLTGWAEIVGDRRWIAGGRAVMRSGARSDQQRVEMYSPAEELFNRRRRDRWTDRRAACSSWRCSSRRCRFPRLRTGSAPILAMMVVLWMSEALPLAVTALVGPVLAVVLGVGAGADRVRAVRRSDHLPVHRQLHAGRGDVRPWPRPAHRVRRPVVARGGRQRRPHPASSTARSAPASRCGSATRRRRR